MMLAVLCSCYIGTAAAEKGETAWSLERLYSDPPLLGTPPGSFTGAAIISALPSCGMKKVGNSLNLALLYGDRQ